MTYSIENMTDSFLRMAKQSSVPAEAYLVGLLSTDKSSVTTFPNCLSDIVNISNYAFMNCINLAITSLPEGLKTLNTGAFLGCSRLALTSIPAGVTIISFGAFNSCTSLTNLTFKGRPSNIDPSAFVGCTNLTTINVPWAEGAVSGAPWGATSATINYNYTGV